jgi:hypothetical protein
MPRCPHCNSSISPGRARFRASETQPLACVHCDGMYAPLEPSLGWFYLLLIVAAGALFWHFRESWQSDPQVLFPPWGIAILGLWLLFPPIARAWFPLRAFGPEHLIEGSFKFTRFLRVILTTLILVYLLCWIYAQLFERGLAPSLVPYL